MIAMVHPNISLATRANIQAMINIVMARYAGYTNIKGKTNFNKLQAIPKFTCWRTINSGLVELTKLHKERASWTAGLVTYEHTEEAKKEHLEALMDGMPDLDFHRQWALVNHFSYAQMLARCIEVSKTIEDKEILQKQTGQIQKKLGEQHRSANMVDGYGAPTGGHYDRAYQWGQQPVYQGHREQDQDEGEDQHENATANPAVGGSRPGLQCWNCGKDHVVRECQEPVCYRGKQCWSSTNPATGYHHPMQCSTNPLQLAPGRYRGPMYPPSAGRGTYGRGSMSSAGRGAGAFGGRGGGYAQGQSAGRGSQEQQGGRGYTSTPITGIKRPASSQLGGRGGPHVPFLPRANAAVSEVPAEDTYAAYNNHCQEYDGQDYTADDDGDLTEDFPPDV